MFSIFNNNFFLLIFYLSFNINISIYYKNSKCFNNNKNLFLKYCLDSNCISPRAHLLRHVASGSGGGSNITRFFNKKNFIFKHFPDRNCIFLSAYLLHTKLAHCCNNKRELSIFFFFKLRNAVIGCVGLLIIWAL